jgi:hypothetical protein
LEPIFAPGITGKKFSRQAWREERLEHNFRGNLCVKKELKIILQAYFAQRKAIAFTSAPRTGGKQNSVARPVRHPIYTGMLAIVMATVIPEGTSRNPQTHPYLRKFVDQIQPRRRSKQGIRNSSGDRQRANNVRGIIPEIQERANKVRGIFTSKLRAAWRCFSRVAGG